MTSAQKYLISNFLEVAFDQMSKTRIGWSPIAPILIPQRLQLDLVSSRPNLLLLINDDVLDPPENTTICKQNPTTAGF